MIFCADDFGLNKHVNESILQLIESKRISATTCMVAGADASDEISGLRKYKNKIDIGMHLVLTDGKAVSGMDPSGMFTDNKGNFHSFPKLVLNLFTLKMENDFLYNEISAQLNLLKNLFHDEIDFLDGHQHVQHLPYVRETVLKFFNKNSTFKYARNSSISAKNILMQEGFNIKYSIQAALISVLGTKFKNMLEVSGVPTNPQLYGYHSYDKKEALARALRFSFGKKNHANDIFFLHSSNAGRADEKDNIFYSRKASFDFFMSNEFLDLLNKYSIQITQFNFV